MHDPQRALWQGERGSALIMAVVAMVVLGALILGFSALANIEARLAINNKAYSQALALAESGLEHGRNILHDAATTGNFNAYIASTATRRLGIASGGITTGAGTYWVRVDNDCSAPTGFSGAPPFVPTAVQDSGVGCSDTVDGNQTVVLTAWAQATDASGRVVGRSRLRAHYTIGNPWKHSCYNGNSNLCIDDEVGGCNNNPCIDPSDPRNPNGPAKGALPIPQQIKCGTSGNGTYPGIDAADIPADVGGRMTSSYPCVIYPYYKWAVHTAAPTRVSCLQIPASGNNYGSNNCSSSGTIGLDLTNAMCTTVATASKCHGLVFFGPPSALATGADITVRTTGGSPDITCVGQQKEDSSANCYNSTLSQSDSLVLYVMGKITISSGAVQGTVVLHGDGTSSTDFGLQGQSQVTTHPCVAGSPAPSPGCGYPLAILAYDPNNPPDPVPTTAVGQSIHLDLSNSSPSTVVSGLIYTGGTADFSPLTVNGGLIGWDVNITNTSTRVVYNPTYGNAAPPPGFTVGEGGIVTMFPATWVHCADYQNDFAGATPCLLN
jgi:Tfp pilus assembly protein PilX